MSDLLQLKYIAPLAKGHSRLVYQHPHRADWLVKVIRPDVIEKRWGSGTAWYKRRRRYGRFISYTREVQEYIVGCLAGGTGPECFQKVVGFADTDMGLGLIVEAVRGADGNLAPTLRELIKGGRFEERARRALEQFQQRLLESDVTISDLNLGNLVYRDSDGDGGGRFVLIDGLGSTAILPFKTLSKTLNRRSKLGRLQRLHLRIERLRNEINQPRV